MPKRTVSGRLPKFGFITDTHFDVRYGCRRDDPVESLTAKFQACYDWFRESGCAFVVHGGDMFNRHRIYNFDLMLRIWATLVGSGLATYFILGQHDAEGYNRGTVAASSLGFLESICDGSLKFLGGEEEVEGYRLVPSHVDADPVKTVNSVKAGKAPAVCVCHALLTDKREAFGTISIKRCRNRNVSLVLSGDLHDGVPFQCVGGTWFYNPGAMGRTSREKRAPKVGALQWDGERFVLEEFCPPCGSPEEVFYWDREEPEAAAALDGFSDASDSKCGVDSFIDAFNRFHASARDVFELLERVGAETGARPEVMDVIRSYAQRMREEK